MNQEKLLRDISALLSQAEGRVRLALSGQTAGMADAQVEAEKAAIKLCQWNETALPRPEEPKGKPALRPSKVTGKIEVNQFGWVHITLNTLLPNCRYRTPEFLREAISRLLQSYTQTKGPLPWFEAALLVINERCDLQNRQVFDQDNKGWKAIPNAIKGVLVPDDDQFTLELALLSTPDQMPSCHIYVLPAEEAGDFFALRTGQYGFCL